MVAHSTVMICLSLVNLLFLLVRLFGYIFTNSVYIFIIIIYLNLRRHF
jgi:hypothetical protein